MVKFAYLKDKTGFVFATEYAEQYFECDRVTKKAYEKFQFEQAVKRLKTIFPVGSVVYTDVCTVSSSGMSRTVKFYGVHDGEIEEVNCLVSWLLGTARAKKGGLILHGCGTDVAYDAVYRMGRILYPEGTAERTDGGYSLKHRTL